jgi:hypothetical protein
MLSRQLYLRTEARRVRVSHPGPNMWHSLRAREHTRQLVPVTKSRNHKEYLRPEA